MPTAPMNRATAVPSPVISPASGQAYQPGQSFQAGAGLNALFSYLQGQGFLSGAGGLFNALGTGAAENTGIYQKNIMPLLQALGQLTGLNIGGANSGGKTQGGVGVAPQGQPGADPYALSAPEATQLAQQVDAVNQHYTSAINSLNQSLTARGIDPKSPEGLAATQYLQSQQQSAVSQVQAGFMEQNRQRKIQDTVQAIATIMGIGQLGQQGTEAAAAGTAGLGSAENAVTGTLSSTANADASSNIGASIISDIGSIIGKFLPAGSFGPTGGGLNFGGNAWNSVSGLDTGGFPVLSGG